MSNEITTVFHASFISEARIYSTHIKPRTSGKNRQLRLSYICDLVDPL